MSEQLKRCSICKSPAEKMWDLQEKLVRCTDRTCHNSLYSVYLNEWQKRPIEDELQARIAELEAEIRNWQDCYCEFETIAPDGNLKISVLDIYNRIAELNDRIAELEAENAALKAEPKPLAYWSDEKKQTYADNEGRSAKRSEE